MRITGRAKSIIEFSELKKCLITAWSLVNRVLAHVPERALEAVGPATVLSPSSRNTLPSDYESEGTKSTPVFARTVMY